MSPAQATAMRRGAALLLIGIGVEGLWGTATALLVIGVLLLLPASGPLVRIERGPGGER